MISMKKGECQQPLAFTFLLHLLINQTQKNNP
jgi:hypothetical protein